MAFRDWRDAARSLRQKLEPADEDQRALAKSLGFELPEGLPARVAASLLERRLASPLRHPPDLPVTPAQEEFLDDLVLDLHLDERPRPKSQQVAGAWIEVLIARRAMEGLERERPAPGDLVEYRRFGRTSVETVSSIGADGQVYLRGNTSPRIPAHRVKVVARRDDNDAGS